MQCPADEVARHHEFLSQKVKALKCLEFDTNSILWHYTTGAGLIGILESGTIWATHVACLNDSSEVRYASSLFRKALLELSLKCEEGDTAKAPITKYLELLDEQEPESPNNAGMPYFVACFSEQRDDINQWVKYSGGENGYAIGMKASDLFGIQNALMVKVNYDAEQHKQIAGEVADATFRFYRGGLERYGKDSPQEWAEAFLTSWDNAITHLAPMVKDPAFSAESEYRIIRQLQFGELHQLKLIQRQSMMSRHLPLRFPRASETRNPKLPIVEVLVGPGPHRKVTAIGVDTLLKQLGYGTGFVKTSSRPFRQV